jgi:phosphinothricin acetyltransferase
MISVRTRPATAADAAAICEIYNHFVRETVITFEVDEVTPDTMAGRIAKVVELGLPWLVAEESGPVADPRGAKRVVGFAYAAPYRDRAAYDHTVEVTIYLHPEEVGRGIGTALYAELFEQLRNLDPATSPRAPVHSLVSVIALPNDASVSLHERLGFEPGGILRESGRKFDSWIDVGLWQLPLEGYWAD